MVNYVPKNLCLIMTDKCNAACSFCGREKNGYQDLSNEDMLNCIEQAHDLNMKEVIFSGGEPTLRYEDLLQGIRYASSRGMKTQIVTNASYSTNEERGLRVAKELEEAGLTMLVFSFDKDHQDHIPYSSVLNATKGALQTYMNTRFKTHFKESTIEENFSLLKKLANDLRGKYEFDGKSPDGKIVVAEKTLPVKQRFIVRAGEAKKLEKSEFEGRFKIRDHEQCHTHEMIVKTNGDITPCCSFEALQHRFYNVGNIGDMSIRTAASRVNESITDFMLSPYSFFRIKNFLEKSGNKEAKKISNRRYTTFCEFCADLFSKQELGGPIVYEFNKFKGAKPEIIFEGGYIGSAGRIKIVVNGKEMNFTDYLGSISFKDFWVKCCEHSLKFLDGRKDKRAIRDKKGFQRQLKIVSEMENAKY